MGNYFNDRNDCRIFSMNNISFFHSNQNKNPLSTINFNGHLQDRKCKIIGIYYYHYYAYICSDALMLTDHASLLKVKITEDQKVNMLFMFKGKQITFYFKIQTYFLH